MADQKVFNGESESRLQHRYAVMVQDLDSFWMIRCNPARTKTVQEISNSSQKFLPSDFKPGMIHIDNSLEFIRACEDLCWNHDKSTPTPLRNQ